MSAPGSDEALRPRPEAEDTGPGLLAAVLARENMQQAWKRVRANKGAAGIDGLGIDETLERLIREWPVIRGQLLQGTYRPQPVRRGMIPKPDGGERELAIPTVTDRLIQQALLLKLYGRLRLKVNEAKSAVASVFQRKFLGYSFWVAPGGKIKRRVAAKAMAAWQDCLSGTSGKTGKS